MSTVNVTIAVTPTPVPSGQVFDHIAVVLTDAAGVAQTNRIDGVATLTTSFAGVAVGPGTVTAQAVDAANLPIGTSVSGTYTAVAPTTFPQPVSVTLTVA